VSAVGDPLAATAFLAYLAAAPVLGAILGAILGRQRLARRLDDANERADFLRAAAADYAQRLAGYQHRETRITLPDLHPGLAHREAREALLERAGRR
jgi:hypothetical protein